MIMAGGTGGHVFPGLAVAKEICNRSGSVIWMGTRKGLEGRLVPEAGIEVEWISMSGLRGRGVLAWVLAPFRLALAIFQAFTALRRQRPAVVLGFGGFVSGPGGIAAWLAGRPLLIHEQNAVAGTTNRILAHFSQRVFQAFPDSFPASIDAELIGNPVRSEILNLYDSNERLMPRSFADSSRTLRLLILGGSQGARALNLNVPEALAILPQNMILDVWHQTGQGFEETRDAYAKHHMEARLDVFLDDMEAAYAWADLVICRAGALTISELTVAGLGAILIPYPYAADDHQLHNAEHFVSGGAGIIIPENELTPARLSEELESICLHPDNLLARFAHSARSQAQPNAARNLAEACFQLAEAQS
jgi:UDP-N-acetylglucosamine--N-acetylmuramyl-(pentapeptide) pyrophosphoryl-undecaprenol N-acetylglucosamine transferase